jgi:hypothetical protein
LLNTHPLHVVAQWMGHDAKVSLKHYAQTTGEHFDRATGGAKSGAVKAQNQAKQAAAGLSKNTNESTQSDEVDEFSALSCELMPDAANENSGEGGIRTLVILTDKLVFETNAFNRSATSPGLTHLNNPTRLCQVGDCPHSLRGSPPERVA